MDGERALGPSEVLLNPRTLMYTFIQQFLGNTDGQGMVGKPWADV